ncbi:MAG: hypothetical protein O2861_01150 [Proteobacteria bacterium]|nr:hypothetical protein [Pseudomonadota bacterium]
MISSRWSIEMLLQAKLQHCISLLVCLVLVSCGSLPDGERPSNALYCDTYLMYDMCAQDQNRDGVVDFVYFTDSEEIFMFREGVQERYRGNLGVHRCAQIMDENLVATTSRVFYVNDETSFLERQDIKGAMMIKYIAYMPEVTACNMRHEQLAKETD